ncbi:hypothetical protein D3C72_585760 [compost metagenome]
MIATEILQAGVDDLPPEQGGKGHGTGAYVDDADRLVPGLQLGQTGQHGTPQRMGPHVHHHGLHAGLHQCTDPAVDALGTRRAQQHLLAALIGRQAEDLEIQTDLIEGEGNELFCLQVNLVLQLVLVDVGINLNDLGDDIGARHGRGHELTVPLYEPLERLEGLTDPFNVLQLIIDQGALGHGDLGNRFEMHLARTSAEGDGLDGLTAKINARQGEEGSLT